MVGAEGFEPPTLCSQSRCATRLRYAPTDDSIVTRNRNGGRHWTSHNFWTSLGPAETYGCGGAEAATRGFGNGIDGTIKRLHGGYSSEAERLTVAQDVVGSIPTSRPNLLPRRLLPHPLDNAPSKSGTRNSVSRRFFDERCVAVRLSST